MHNSLIPGLDNLSLTHRGQEGRKVSEISLSIFRDTFRIPESLSIGNCRSLDEFEKKKDMRQGCVENFYEYDDSVKKRPVTIVGYSKQKSLDKDLKYLLHEVEIIRSLKHFNILEYYEAASSQLTLVYLVFEPCSCFLSDLIATEVEKLYQLPVIKTVMLQLFEALNYMHENSIMHRNIHPESIAFNGSGCLKVCNFRNARWLWDEDISVQTNENRYQSPELLMGTEICGTPVDIWSAACILVHLLLSRCLFGGNDPRHILKEIFCIFGFPTKECWPEFFKLPEFSFFAYDEEVIHSYNYLDLYFKQSDRPQNENTMDLLQSMFYFNPKNRFSANQCSSHPFFSEDPKASTSNELVHCVNICLTRQAVKQSESKKKTSNNIQHSF